MQTRPDILVLGGGGRAADAWLTGVLAGIEDASGFELSGCDYFVGTSAGSVVAARLVAGLRLARPALDASDVATAQRAPKPNAFANWALALGGPVASIGLRATTTPGALARRTLLRAARAERETLGPMLAQADLPWDGRLRVVAVERRNGRRVVFGAPGAPDATVDQAVQASCSVPLMFGPTVIDGVEYVDGGVWSITNADVAPAARGAQVLVLAPTASLHGPLNPAFRAASRAAALVEASALTARQANVRRVAPDRDAARAIGRALMSSARLPEILAAGYRQGLAL
jgi:NTE family protein